MAIKMKELEKAIEMMIEKAITERMAAKEAQDPTAEAYCRGKRDALQTILWAGLRG